MSVARELEELYRILEELRKRIKAVEAVSREIAGALSLIATLQERMLGVLERILSKLDEHSQRLDTIERGMEELNKRVDRIERDLRDLKVMVGRLAGELEEEARDGVPYMLDRIIGKRVKLERLSIEGVVEVSLYGTTDDLCVLGDVKTRIGPSVVKKLCRALLTLYEEKRNLLRDRIILVTYGLDVIEVVKDLVKECGIGVFTPRGVIVEPRAMRLEEAVETCRHALDRLK